ncbi:Hsp20/alpha crystallin family protein [Luteibaculum oceani]|uniref:Hsp20/alpha crystallin family protein n=1 Tax=Luteibaculum oceani TaxID=1294296 RepID=A0A5C6V0X2_9FLAO|nr:Hsp20/alpha crystallin family protein [Luteibaculum oceani]TXC78510.1 Hsp20/alpha crystallin family protein [Luteibaculum oceani]
MTIVKRNNGLLPDFFSSLLNEDWPITNGVSDGALSVPAVNIRENEKGFMLELAAPGYAKEDLKIDLDDRLLTLSAEIKEERNSSSSNENPEKFTRREFNYSSFKRSFTLPETIDESNIEASYQDGLLKVSLPKKAELTKPMRQIAIK